MPEITIDMGGDLRIVMKMTPSGNPHLNSETNFAAL